MREASKQPLAAFKEFRAQVISLELASENHLILQASGSWLTTMGKSSGVNWTQVALASLQAGAQALLAASDLSALEAGEIDFSQIDNMMKEIGDKMFLETYGYTYAPGETIPPLMIPNQVPFNLDENVVQKSDDPSEITQYLTGSLKGSFRVSGVEAPFIQDVIQLIQGLRSQPVSNMQAFPKRYNIQGTAGDGPNNSRMIGFDGVIVWANVELPDGLYTIVRFTLVHYEEIPALALASLRAETVSKTLRVSSDSVGSFVLEGNGKADIRISTIQGGSATVQISTMEGSTPIYTKVELSPTKPAYSLTIDAKPHSSVIFYNEKESSGIFVHYSIYRQ